MIALVQRVTFAELKVDGKLISQIGKGLIVYLGVKVGDGEAELDYTVNKTANLRVFEDDLGKMNLSVKDVGGEILVVSQFTLYGSVERGFRPSFTDAEAPEKAEKLYRAFIEKIAEKGISVKSGIFGADMKIQYLNDGPVSVIIQKERQ